MRFGSWLSIMQKEGVNFLQVSGFFSPDKSRIKVTVTFLQYSYFFPIWRKSRNDFELNRAITTELLTLADPCSVMTPFLTDSAQKVVKGNQQ